MRGRAPHDENGPLRGSKQFLDRLAREESSQTSNGGCAPDDQVSAAHVRQEVPDGEGKSAHCAHRDAVSLAELQSVVRQSGGSIFRRSLP
ncbi:MAG: hypothetical protein ABUU24_01355, partial [Variovorax sp.]